MKKTSHRRVVRYGVLFVAICSLSLVSRTQSTSSHSDPPEYIGVLKANPIHASTDLQAGVNLVEIGIRWDEYEPKRGIFDATYRQQILDRIEVYRRAGMKISLATATQYTPAWIKADPSMQSHSQFPGDTSGMANLFFDQQVRDLAEEFIADVVHHAGPVDFYRVGLSHHGEIVMPVASRGQWWAMDPKAQGDIPGRPSSIPPPPFRHWYPGQPLNGRAATVAELRQWWLWYLHALVDAHDWEASAIRRAGFRGPLQYVIPGPGVRPLALKHALQNGLASDPQDAFHQVNVGTAWYLLIPQLKDRNAFIDISSVYDHSGTPRGNACQTGDLSVDYLHDPAVNSWSSTRWLALLAKRNGFRTIGENPGQDSAEVMSKSFALAQSCGLTGLQWAFDDELYDGQHASIEDLAQITGQSRTDAPETKHVH